MVHSNQRLGATVPLPLADLGPALHPAYSPLAKTKFSMVLPEVEQSLKEWDTSAVVLFGIEVRRFTHFRIAS